MEKEKIRKNGKSLKILAIQMCPVIGDKWENFAKITDLIEKNFKRGTDIIVLPEFCNIGFKPNIFRELAEELNNSETIEFLSELAQKYNTNIIGGSFISKRINKFYNTCPVINRDGELIATYDKMHLFSYYGCKEGEYLTKGEKPVMIDIDGIKIGLSLCYEIRFPELYRAYRKAGADLLINMAAWPKSRAIHWEALSKARAIENQCFMVALTQSGLIEGNEYNLGHSRIIDYNGEIIAEIKDQEGAMFAEIKFDEIYKFREKCTVLKDICTEYKVN